MTKKLITIISAITLTLSGCFGATEEAPSTTISNGKNLYQTSEFSIQAPLDWEAIQPKDFTSNTPLSTQLILRNDVKSSIFTANLSVNRNQFGNPSPTSEDFAKGNNMNAKKSLVGYQEISSTTRSFPLTEESIPAVLSQFTGKKNASSPIIHFKRLDVVNNGLGMSVTAAHLPNEEESVVKILDEMIESFALK